MKRECDKVQIFLILTKIFTEPCYISLVGSIGESTNRTTNSEQTARKILKRRRTHEERTESEARVKQGRSTNEPRQTSNFILLSAYICKRSKIVFEQVGNRSRKSRTNRECTVRKFNSEARTNSEKLNEQRANNGK